MPLTKAEIARLRGLRLKKNREASATFIVEGSKVVNELIAAGHKFESIYA
ncbi:MAG: TrmH family RNA methyltransferase, partial [Verrucomicrobiia bacterium]